MTFQAKVLYDFESVGEGELSVKAGDIVTITNPDVGQGWWFGVGVDGKEGVIPEAYVERMDATAYAPGAETRRTSDVTQVSNATSWGDDWDSDEDHTYEDPQDLIQAPPHASVVKTSQDAATGKSKGSRPSSIVAEPGYAFSLGKFSSVFGKSGPVGDYLTGLTESSATLAKEAVVINEPSKGYFQ